MAFTYEDTLKDQWQILEAERAEALAEYERARTSEDALGVREAGRAILRIDNEKAALAQVANRLVARQQPPPPVGADDLSRRDVDLASRYGLSAQEVAIAKGWTSSPSLSDEDRVKTYIEQRQKYRQQRASGEYRDDQGVVRR
jgi:hypothetical protein